MPRGERKGTGQQEKTQRQVGAAGLPCSGAAAEILRVRSHVAEASRDRGASAHAPPTAGLLAVCQEVKECWKLPVSALGRPVTQLPPRGILRFGGAPIYLNEH